MVISVNNENSPSDFNNLLSKTVEFLNTQAVKSPSKFKNLAGNKLEPHVKDVMEDLAQGTPFANTIELISGQKFPDIVAKNYYGVEVKTTTGNHWKSTGNSVLETTRVPSVERIFMLFGKLGQPIEFRSRPYEECLSEVVVTHSPRYLIDMELQAGNTIFDKLQIPYDQLRKKDNPINPIVSYYKSKLKPGQDIWWMDTSNSSTLIIKIWNSLTKKEKSIIKLKVMIYFPEIFSNTTRKYDNIPAWLVKTEGIVCKNIRDLFTAGGRVDIQHQGKIYKGMPKIVSNMHQQLSTIKQAIIDIPAAALSEYWGIKTTEDNKYNDWQNLVLNNIQTIIGKRAEEVRQLFLTI